MTDLFEQPKPRIVHTMRDYQARCIDSVLNEFQSVQSTLAVSPTGTGKSVIFSQIIKRSQPSRTLVLADRGELIHQAAQHVNRTGLSTDIEKAELITNERSQSRAQVVVASVQTLIAPMRTMDGKTKRMTKFNPRDFGLIICDEADCFLAPSHQSILNYFKQGNPDIKIFGCTATPKRKDEQALGKIFDSVAFTYELYSDINPSAIGDGWLVPVKSLMLDVEGLDFSHISATGGDFNGRELSDVMEAEQPLYGVAQGTLEACFGLAPNTLHGIPVLQWRDYLLKHKPSTVLAFTVSIKQAEMLSDIFNRVVPGVASWVCGKTPSEDRDRINKEFKAGDLPILCNCGTHTTGFDAPKIATIVPKPTASNRLYFQMIGRGTRPAEVDGRSIVDQHPTADERKAAIAASAKPFFTVLDFCGVSGNHRPVNMADVLGGDFDDDIKARAMHKVKEAKQGMDMSEAMDVAEAEIKAEREAEKAKEAARRAHLVGKAKFSVRTSNLFDVLGLTPARARGWDEGKQLSTKQSAILIKQGIDPSSMPYTQAKQILDETFRRWGSKLCTIKQAKLLSKHGVNTRELSMKDAGAMITELANNHWQAPASWGAQAAPVSDTNGGLN